ncbi:hypothetical protein ACGFX8_37150 [Streptomyces sp. NPDC048362]|uniref:hypothetical protein n=1 Tax=Streptomyces sp. NPDC048362 TaxID=3365539 RepID=UPI00372355B9
MAGLFEFTPKNAESIRVMRELEERTMQELFPEQTPDRYESIHAFGAYLVSYNRAQKKSKRRDFVGACSISAYALAQAAIHRHFHIPLDGRGIPWEWGKLAYGDPILDERPVDELIRHLSRAEPGEVYAITMTADHLDEAHEILGLIPMDGRPELFDGYRGFMEGRSIHDYHQHEQFQLFYLGRSTLRWA